MAGLQRLGHWGGHPDAGWSLPVHTVEVPVPGQVPVAFQLHSRALERRERTSSIFSNRFGPRHFLRWLLLVINASDVWRGRRKCWLDAGAGIGHGHRKEHAVGPELKLPLGCGPNRLGIDYRNFALVKRVGTGSDGHVTLTDSVLRLLLIR